MTPEQFEDASRLMSLRRGLLFAIRSLKEKGLCGVHSVTFDTFASESGRLTSGTYSVMIEDLELDPDDRSNQLFGAIMRALEEYLRGELAALDRELKKLGLEIDLPGADQ